MIASPNHSSRGGKGVRLVIIHTAEGARTVESLGSYFSKSSVGVSSHAGIDDKRIETYVPYDQQAWTVRSGNAISDNVELCGFAAWTRTQWLNEHRPMLELTARWIAERCKARGIPIRKLTPAEVKAGQAGVCGHIDWTLGMKDGSHTDPGPGFPWDVVMQLAAGQVPAGTISWVAVPAPVLHEGDGAKGKADRGELHWFVWTAQGALRDRGVAPNLVQDGVFGPATTAAVKALQTRNLLTADGVIGDRTWPWLLGNLAPDFR